ncbi:MAG: hypothetical protein L0H59_12860, partial [Tomitella sp.]|nr:hypothetical protein [Tomitella sp.]
MTSNTESTSASRGVKRRSGDCFDPASQASIRLSPQQRLLGQAANGDVVAANFALDYTAQLL